MSSLFDFFHFIPFLIGLSLGILYIMMGGRGTHETIYKYPHPSMWTPWSTEIQMVLATDTELRRSAVIRMKRI